MNSNNYETYADAVNGKAGVAVPPTATNEAAAVPLVAEASARSDVVQKKFEFPKKFCRSGKIIGKENQSSTSICNTNVYGVLDNDESEEIGSYPSTWKLDNSGKRKKPDTNSVPVARNVRAKKKLPVAASDEVDNDDQHPSVE